MFKQLFARVFNQSYCQGLQKTALNITKTDENRRHSNSQQLVLLVHTFTNKLKHITEH